MATRITDLSHWLMLGVLIYAPWAFGSTRGWSIDLLNALVGIVLVARILSAAAERRWPKVPAALALVSVVLAGYAWWMAANAKFAYDWDTWTFEPRPILLASAPGSIDHDTSWAMAQRVSALLAAVCLLCEMGSSNRWRKRLILTLTFAGISIAGFGLVQRALGAPSILWLGGDTGTTFFATYRYHSNAGAFLNIVWPLAAVFCVNSWRRGERWTKTASWGGAVMLCFCGLVVSGARAASAVAVILLIFWAGWIALQIRRGQLPAPARSVVVIGACLLGLLLVSMAALTGLDVSARRWGKIEELFSPDNPRLLVDYICLKMIPEAGWFGFGPGTFRVAFPYYTHELGNSISGVWRYAHQDYLQTVIEWGYVGAVLWAAWLIGGFLSAAKAARRVDERLPFRERTLQFGLATALGGVLLHALVDFPLQIASIQLYFGAMLAVFWSQSQWETVARTAAVPEALLAPEELRT